MGNSGRALEDNNLLLNGPGQHSGSQVYPAPQAAGDYLVVGRRAQTLSDDKRPITLHRLLLP
jgi:hypothetical protein